jgi:hypothetical protein
MGLSSVPRRREVSVSTRGIRGLTIVADHIATAHDKGRNEARPGLCI